MPCKAEGLVLTVDPNVIHKVDTGNPQNLFSMWTVFSRCADSVEQGRRLENLSWRLWNRETFCCEPGKLKQNLPIAASLPKDIPEQRAVPDVPHLSESVESASDEEAVEMSTECSPMDIARPHIVRQDSCTSSRSRGRERHFTSDNLEKMVVSIIQEKEPNLAPLTNISSPSLQSESDESQVSSIEEPQQMPATPATEPFSSSEDMTTETSVQSEPSEPSSQDRATNVVRGFSPSHIPSIRMMSHGSKPSLTDAIPEPHSSPAHKPVQLKKQPIKFALGCSSGDESSPQSLDNRQTSQPKKMFEVGAAGGSSAEEESPSLKSALHTARPGSMLSAQKKQASFSNQVTMRTIHTPSDQSDSYVDESAIDDDDEDSEWEDSIEESGKSSMDDPVTFKRVPSTTKLPSQRSLISLMFAGQDQRAKALSNHASQSTSAIAQRTRSLHTSLNAVASPNDSDDNGLEMKKRAGLRQTPLKPINEVPRTGAQPILTSAHTQQHQAALSPRTTRRNMLATELTESLRRNLLWERQQKSSTANAVLKRRHTSHDVANLKQYPEKVYMSKAKDEANPSSWNQYFTREALGGYHAQGW